LAIHNVSAMLGDVREINMSQIKKNTANNAEAKRTQSTTGAQKHNNTRDSTGAKNSSEKGRERNTPEKRRGAANPTATNEKSRNKFSDENKDADKSRNFSQRSRTHSSAQRPQRQMKYTNNTQKQSDKYKSAHEAFEVKAPETPLEPITLSDLSPALQEACVRIGWAELMPVQAHALPYILAKQDMMIQSRTGSGKTGAYLIPIFTQLAPERKECQALIIVPTRELALQVEQEAKNLFAAEQVKIVAIYGGVGYGKQLEALQKGAHIVVGTPGRVLDHLLRRTLILDNLRVLIFDEADRMLSIGFYPDMKEIQRYLPKKSILVNLFSATYPPRVLQLASEFLHNPQMLSLSQGQVHVATSQHFYCECSSMDKDRSLVRLLEKENPTSAIIFCNTKANVHYVTSVLQGFGYNADELSADLSQARREQVLKRLRNGEIRFLVATDVAARGIDIPELSHVFLYEPPDDRESYIHRAGRTGRAGAAGTVISLVDIMQKLEIERIAKHYKIDIMSLKIPSNEEIAAVSGERMVTLLEAKRRLATGLELERAKRFLPLVKELSNNAEEKEQLILLALILDGEYQRSLGASPKSIQQTLEAEPVQKSYNKSGNGRNNSQKRRP